MSITTENIIKAINGESNAVEKYKSFQKIALDEGFNNISLLFKALVIAEEIHIKNHSHVIKDLNPEIIIKDFEKAKTIDNLKNSIEGEIYEYKTMYPEFLKEIKKEKSTIEGKLGMLSMEWAKNVELTHAKALRIALKYCELGKDLDFNEIWVCRVCGNLVLGKKPDSVCPICKHDSSFYQQIFLNF